MLGCRNSSSTADPLPADNIVPDGNGVTVLYLQSANNLLGVSVSVGLLCVFALFLTVRLCFVQYFDHS